MIWPYPRVVAHRGAGTLAPENTLGAIRHGASLGFRGVEFDVMLAGDGTPLLIHDETLERTTDGKGAVAHMPYAEIAKFDAGRWLAERWSGERVPLFADAGCLCRELGVWANVEIKPAKGFEAQTGRAVAEMARELWRGADRPPVLSSFAPEALIAAKVAGPELPRGMLVGRVPADWKARMRELDCVAVHCDYRTLTQPLLEEIHASGYAVLVWTVNDPREAKKLLDWGIDCIVTDRLDLIAPHC
ncbi:MAG: glycerophosphodiester phosphodiesterase [Betaproteobacteria bacterium]|nr:glycerophosphodiester phosphodiesterase [Betaproteobacteria bacterium]